MTDTRAQKPLFDIPSRWRIALQVRALEGPIWLLCLGIFEDSIDFVFPKHPKVEMMAAPVRLETVRRYRIPSTCSSVYETPPPPPQKPKLLDRFHQQIRTRHYSRRTIRSEALPPHFVPRCPLFNPPHFPNR
jgi:hypothetical protein